jgi:hypothetical protein
MDCFTRLVKKRRIGQVVFVLPFEGVDALGRLFNILLLDSYRILYPTSTFPLPPCACSFGLHEACKITVYFCHRESGSLIQGRDRGRETSQRPGLWSSLFTSSSSATLPGTV